MKNKFLYIVSAVLIGATAIVAVNCNNNDEKKILVTELTLDRTAAVLNQINDFVQLNATVKPGEATNKTLDWKSDKPNIAEVDRNGKVTAKSDGEANITATTTDGSALSASCKVTVNTVPPEVPVESVTFDGESNILVELALNGENNEIQLTATVLPENATVKNVVWDVNPTGIVEINNGKLTAKGKGEATITVISESDAAKFATCKVTVVVLVESVEIEGGDVTINVLEEKRTLTAKVLPENASNAEVTWSTSAADKVAVNAATGEITAKDWGEATITATLKDDPTQKATCKVKVERVSVSSVEIEGGNISMSILEEKKTLTATVLPSNATNKTVAWSTSDASKVAVNTATGEITAKDWGTATITATSNENSEKKASITVTVEPVLVTGISLNKTSTTVRAGEVETLTVNYTPANASFKDNSYIGWVSDNNTFATVDNTGKVTGVAQGNAVITATYTCPRTSATFTAQCTVKVPEPGLIFEVDFEDGTQFFTSYSCGASNVFAYGTTNNAEPLEVVEMPFIGQKALWINILYPGAAFYSEASYIFPASFCEQVRLSRRIKFDVWFSKADLERSNSNCGWAFEGWPKVDDTEWLQELGLNRNNLRNNSILVNNEYYKSTIDYDFNNYPNFRRAECGGLILWLNQYGFRIDDNMYLSSIRLYDR